MPETINADADSDKPFWDSSQLTQRAWLDDLLPWLPTCNSSYASLIEDGYTLYAPYTLVAPSPVAPTFIFPCAPAAPASAGPAAHSTPASAAPASVTPAAQPVSSGPTPVTSIRNLSADERNHFVISP
eukprot:6213412-Pleurochrysis_carterae.AAC.2